MSDEKRSHGQWHADGPAVYTQYQEPVAVCGPGGPYEANARFIADAPYMLDLISEQLDVLTEIGGRHTDWEVRARALLDRHGRG